MLAQVRLSTAQSFTSAGFVLLLEAVLPSKCIHVLRTRLLFVSPPYSFRKTSQGQTPPKILKCSADQQTQEAQ